MKEGQKASARKKELPFKALLFPPSSPHAFAFSTHLRTPPFCKDASGCSKLLTFFSIRTNNFKIPFPSSFLKNLFIFCYWKGWSRMFSLGWRILFHLFIFLSLFPLQQFFQIATWKAQILAKEAKTKSVAGGLQAFLKSYQNTNDISWMGRNEKKGGRRDQGKEVYVQNLQNRKWKK